MSEARAARPQYVLLGVGLVIAAAFAISVQDVVFKLFSSELTLWQIFALRGVLAIPMLLTVSWMRGAHRGLIATALGPWPLLRAVCITTTFLAFYAAIPFLSLSTVGAANYIAPIFVTLLSAYALREAVSWHGWLGVLLGFAGVIVLLQPGTDAFSAWALLPICGAGFYAAGHILTRSKCQGVSLPAMALALNLVMFLAGAIISALLYVVAPQGGIFDAFPYIFGQWSNVDWKDWMVLALLATFAIVIGMLLAGAYQAAPPSIVATFEYTYLAFVATWDVLFFDTTPSLVSAAGIVLIVVAGLMVLRC